MTGPDEQIASILADAKERGSRAAEFGRQVAGLRVTVHSDDGNVTVTSGPGGIPVDLQLTERALNQAPQQLAQSILATMRLGTAQVARRTMQLAEDSVGDRPELMARLRRSLPALDGEAALAGTAAPARQDGRRDLGGTD